MNMAMVCLAAWAEGWIINDTDLTQILDRFGTEYTDLKTVPTGLPRGRGKVGAVFGIFLNRGEA